MGVAKILQWGGADKFNAIFSKTGRCASEPVILSLLRSKCMPILLYAVEAFLY